MSRVEVNPSAPTDSLTGVWDGLYSYPRGRAPVPFTAVIMEIGTTLSGSIHEVSDTGSAQGQTLTASLSGEHLGSEVRFTKVYDAGSDHHTKPVVYDGQLNDDATEIEGTWTIKANWSGKFLMVRSSPPPVAAEERARQTEPVS